MIRKLTRKKRRLRREANGAFITKLYSEFLLFPEEYLVCHQLSRAEREEIEAMDKEIKAKNEEYARTRKDN